jgi:hypothetical protein
MILGVTVPRMFSSWIATKVNILNVDEKKIVSPADKKSKNREEILKKFMKKPARMAGGYNRVFGIFFIALHF